MRNISLSDDDDDDDDDDQAGDINRSSASSDKISTITNFYSLLQVGGIACRCGDSVVYRLEPCLAIQEVVGSTFGLPTPGSSCGLDAYAFLSNEA